MHTHPHPHVHAHVDVPMCIVVSAHVHVCVYTHICVYGYVYVNTCDVYIYTYIIWYFYVRKIVYMKTHTAGGHLLQQKKNSVGMTCSTLRAAPGYWSNLYIWTNIKDLSCTVRWRDSCVFFRLKQCFSSQPGVGKPNNPTWAQSVSTLYWWKNKKKTAQNYVLYVTLVLFFEMNDTWEGEHER